jgi:hypothetical protein
VREEPGPETDRPRLYDGSVAHLRIIVPPSAAEHALGLLDGTPPPSATSSSWSGPRAVRSQADAF